MFTGIVRAVGVCRSFAGGVLEVDVEPFDEPWTPGESVSVNGCCLTLVSADGGLRFVVSEETRSRTTLGPGLVRRTVNVERALRPMDRMGGHWVQGHVDARGRVLAVGPMLEVEAPSDGARYLIDKGSIAVDGVSLTVVSPVGSRFHAALVPHTLSATSLGGLAPGDPVNLEYDVLAKYVERLIRR